MKTLLAIIVFSTAVTTSAFAQPADEAAEPAADQASEPSAPAHPQKHVSATTEAALETPAALETKVTKPTAPATDETDEGWSRPAGRRFAHGFRLGWMYIQGWDKPTRDGGMSLKDELKLKTPNMMLLGYEGFYRIVGHSWLNVLMVGNVTVSGLEQSKFIPAASGLIGFELDRNFQIGIGVNLTPDPQSPSHMIAAAGWTPRVGSIQTPLHFFYVPDASGNSRMGATIGMNW
jgi:hypothetical protein